MKEPVRAAKATEKAALQLAAWLKRWAPIVLNGKVLYANFVEVPIGACDLVRAAEKACWEHRRKLLAAGQFKVVGDESNPDEPDEPPPGSNDPPNSAA
jgi:hypothetical protein